MHLFALVVVVCVLADVAAGQGGRPRGPPPGTLVVDEEFDSPKLNRSVFVVLEQVHRGGLYTADNVYIANGSLVLRQQALQPPVVVDGTPFYVGAGAVNTSGLVEQRYGRWEIRAKLPAAGFTPGFVGHNSFWLINTLRQEIDIFEQVAWDSKPATTNTTISTNLHLYNCSGAAGVEGETCSKLCDGDGCGPGAQWRGVADWAADFHVYGFEWREDFLEWRVDGRVTTRFTTPAAIASLNNPLFLALTACVMNRVPVQPGDVFPQLYFIDYVKIWT